jgi:predicted transcriptional regulator of viral defense system/very-short-patch-repair endonuclease
MLATRQHGVVAVRQLEALGITAKVARDRAAAGRLHRIHRGVYAVGHPRLTIEGRWMAAVLACGDGAVLSHRDALSLHDLRAPPSGPTDVTVVSRGRRSPRNIRIHCVRALDPRDTTVRDGIPVTTVARTVLDFADTAHRQAIRLVLEACERRDALDGRALDALLARSNGRRGAQRVRDALAEMTGPAPWTQSHLERRFLALVREAGLPEPQANVVLSGELVDFYWPQARLAVELDGWRFHKTRAQFEDDRRRDAKLTLLDIAVIRLTDRRLTAGASRTAAELRALLARRAA